MFNHLAVWRIGVNERQAAIPIIANDSDVVWGAHVAHECHIANLGRGWRERLAEVVAQTGFQASVIRNAAITRYILSGMAYIAHGKRHKATAINTPT